ncbi:MAG: helix-turn-helix transcriptional regulator [Polaromonas sp.]|nr:helix-turn-helix transcriptional regulator [Polaromonas sp.]
MASRLVEIGERLRAYRTGAGLSADELGEKLNISRATVYRLESSGIGRIDTLGRVAALLNVSLETLLGVGVEYVPSALAYFERLRQIEAEADQMFVVFGPLIYLLTSPAYDEVLRNSLLAQAASSPGAKRPARTVEDLMKTLAARKAQYALRRPAVTNVLSMPELARFAQFGLVDASAPTELLAQNRAMARDELRRVAGMLVNPQLGVQIGVLFDELPTTSFSVIRRRAGSVALTSPFRLGPTPNIWRGVGMISQAPDSVRLHTSWARDLWSEVMTGERAADYITRRLLQD